MKNLIRLFTILIFSLAVKVVFGALPTWQVTPGSYTYTMNITAQLNLNCADLNDSTNMLGAFVGNDCRGVVQTSNVVLGNHLAFLTVYSNSYSGDTISFRLYDANTDSVYAIAVQVVFTDGAALGSPSEPFLIAPNDLPKDISLTKNTVIENLNRAFVGKLSTQDGDDTVHTYQLVSGIGDTNNTDFILSGDSLFTSKPLSYDVKPSRSVRVETSDGNCSFQKIFRISIKDTNNYPTLIVLSQDSIIENNAIMSVVGGLQTVDFDSLDTHSYFLVNGPGDDDNLSFVLDNGQLRIAVVANYEVKSAYSVLIASDDGDGGVINQPLLITVGDINERPVIRDTTIEISEDFSVNSDIAPLKFIDEDFGDTHTFSIIQPSPFIINNKNLRLATALDYEMNDVYDLSVVVADAEGLSDTARIVIKVTDAIDAELPATKVITPNGDGINDFFVIQNVELYREYSLKIYNAAGLLVYDRPNNYDNSWGGTHNGNTLDSDVYYYLFQNVNNSDSYFKGAISILR